MPKETITIENFQGMIGAADPRQLPDGYAPYSKYQDPSAEQGSLAWLKADTDLNVAGTDPINGRAFTLFEDGDKAAYYDLTATKIKIVKDLKNGSSGSIAAADIVDPGVASAAEDAGQATGVSDGNAIHFGLGSNGSFAPKWVGDISHGQFWTGTAFAIAAAGDNQVVDAVLISEQTDGDNLITLSNITGTQADSAADTLFDPDSNYTVYGVPIYDYLQEGPIPQGGLNFAGLIAPTGAYGWSDVTVRVNVRTGELSKRVTGVALYRAEWPHGAEAPGPLRMWKTLDITSSDSTWTSTTVGVDAAYYLDYTDNGDVVGATYEERTGIPPTLDHMNVHYGVSCVYNGFHFVGRCYIDGSGDATTLILRSKPYRFDTFDWSKDFVSLPVVPNALVGHAGRIYAFADGVTYVLGLDLSIEDEIIGKGAFHKESVIATDRGLFFADSRGIYFLETGDVAKNVGIDVWTNTEVTTAAYQNNVNSFTSPAIALYDANLDAFVLAWTESTGYTALVYYPDRGWTQVPLGLTSAGDLSGGFVGINGVAHLCEASTLSTLFTSSTGQAGEWRSPHIHFNGERFIVYKARVTTKNAPDSSWFSYYEDGGAANTLAAASWTNKGGGIYEAQVNSASGPWTQVREFKMIISGDTDQILRRIDLVVRRMPTL